MLNPYFILFVPAAKSGSLPFCFDIISKAQGTLTVRAMSHQDMDAWILALGRATAAQLEAVQMSSRYAPTLNTFITPACTLNISSCACVHAFVREKKHKQFISHYIFYIIIIILK